MLLIIQELCICPDYICQDVYFRMKLVQEFFVQMPLIIYRFKCPILMENKTWCIQNLNKDHEKDILDEFQQLDEDGFIPYRKFNW